MALPIKDTPVLKGTDAERFQKRILNLQEQAVTREDYERAMRVYSLVKTAEPASFKS